jgi:hypothetical protein
MGAEEGEIGKAVIMDAARTHHSARSHGNKQKEACLLGADKSNKSSIAIH